MAELVMTIGSCSVTGKRSNNEDSFIARPEVGIWAVADGMGGHNAGDLASNTVIGALKSIVPGFIWKDRYVRKYTGEGRER